MDIDLNKYSMQELYEINSAVVRQIKALQKVDAKEKSISFKIGQEVWFVTRSGERIEGKLARFLPKNLEVHHTNPVTKQLTKWKVSPHLVRAVEPDEKEDVIGDLGGSDVSDFGAHRNGADIPTSGMDRPRTGHTEAW